MTSYITLYPVINYKFSPNDHHYDVDLFTWFIGKFGLQLGQLPFLRFSQALRNSTHMYTIDKIPILLNKIMSVYFVSDYQLQRYGILYHVLFSWQYNLAQLFPSSSVVLNHVASLFGIQQRFKAVITRALYTVRIWLSCSVYTLHVEITSSCSVSCNV